MDNNGNGDIRAAIYTRVSTQEQALNNTSLEYQSTQLTKYCEAQGWTIYNVYVDDGYSGKDGNRPRLQNLLSGVKSDLYDKVVVLKLDRLARNLRLLLEIDETCKEHNVGLVSMKESLDTSTSIGRTVFGVLGLVAQWERESIIERTKSGRMQRYLQGCWAGGTVPFGYNYDKGTKKLVLNEDTGRIIRRIYTDYNDGKSLSAIAAILNEEKVHVRSKKGKGWRPTSIRQILINPAYRGTQVVNRHSNMSNITKIDLSKTIQFPVPTIVDDQVWYKAQDRLSNNKHVKPKKQKDFLLQGLISCGICGFSYQTQRAHSNRYYICRGKLKVNHLDGSPKCQSHLLKAEWLENEVWIRVLELLNNPNQLAQVIRRSIEDLKLREAELSARIRPIEERLTEIAQQKAKLADDWIIRNMDKTKFQEIQSNLEKEESRLKLIKANIDPAQIEELEQSRGKLRFWEGQLISMAWNTENEDGTMVRSMDKPHRTALRVVGFEDKDLTKIIGFPATKRELFDKLQLKLVATPDRIEVKGLFPIEPIDCQLCTSIS